MAEKTLAEQLAELKTGLLAEIAQKAKDETGDLRTMVAGINEKIGKMITPEEKADLLNLKTLITEINDTVKKNQPLIDAWVTEGKGTKIDKPETKAFNTMLAELIQENEAAIRGLKKGKSLILDMKAVADMSFANNFSTAGVSVANLRPGIIELPRRKLHIRQLLQQGAMTGSTFYFVKEVAGEESPETVAEGTLKNQFDLDLQESNVPAEYIAGWLRISTKMLDDVQGLTTFLQGRLMEKLLRVEDGQLLNGNGTSPNISGITDTGNFTAPASPYTATIDVEQLVMGIAQLESYDREANGILLSPKDYYSILLNKASTSGEYDLPPSLVPANNGSTRIATSQNGQLFIAGVPCFRSTAAAVGTYIVGDWTMGANLLIREAPKVEFFYEDGTNVRENKVTVRVEERIAFPIYGDNYFIVGTF